MGLVNARNLRKAKELLEKNRHKVGDVVGKATTKIDEVSGGKTTNLSKKAEEAARKYSEGGVSHVADPEPSVVPPDAPAAASASASAMTHEQLLRHQAEVNLAAANALTAAANSMLTTADQLHAETADPPSADDRNDTA